MREAVFSDYSILPLPHHILPLSLLGMRTYTVHPAACCCACSRPLCSSLSLAPSLVFALLALLLLLSLCCVCSQIRSHSYDSHGSLFVNKHKREKARAREHAAVCSVWVLIPTQRKRVVPRLWCGRGRSGVIRKDGLAHGQKPCVKTSRHDAHTKEETQTSIPHTLRGNDRWATLWSNNRCPSLLSNDRCPSECMM